MLKIIFLFIVLIHALIHLLGFVKAFNLTEISQLTQPISKTSGNYLINFNFVGDIVEETYRFN